MNTVEEYINSLHIKLQVFIKKYIALKKENLALTDAVKELTENEKFLSEKINILETQNSILKASAGNMSNDEKKEFEKKIKDYIKDIDACITMLNN